MKVVRQHRTASNKINNSVEHVFKTNVICSKKVIELMNYTCTWIDPLELIMMVRYEEFLVASIRMVVPAIVDRCLHSQ